jgi:hypothetical protein
MSPIYGRPSRKPARQSPTRLVTETPSGNVPEEDRQFIYEDDASEAKYMHHFDKLGQHLDVGRISSSEHKLRNHPHGEMKSMSTLLNRN